MRGSVSSKISIILIIIFTAPPFVRESINLKWNGYFPTKPNKIKELLASIKHHICHRSTPVQNKNQTMILTIRNHGNFFEKVLIVPVSMKTCCIKNSSASSRCASILIGCLATLKLFHQIINFLLCRRLKLLKLKVRFFV